MNEVGNGLQYRGHHITYCDFSRRPYLDGGVRITEGYTFSAAPGATWARTVDECKALVDLYEDTKGKPVNDWGGFRVEYRERKAARLGQMEYKGFFIRRGDVWCPNTIVTNDDYREHATYFVVKRGENALPNRPSGISAYFRSVDEAIIAVDVFSNGYADAPHALWSKVEAAIAAERLDFTLTIDNVHQAHVLATALDRYIEALPKDADGKSLLIGSVADQRLRNAHLLRERMQLHLK